MTATPNSNRRSVRHAGAALMLAGMLVVTGCGSGDPLDVAPGSEADAPLVVGSQDYYSNEIIAELYAQALEAGGYTVDRQLRIGQREVYMPELAAGAIDVFPEYTGNLLQFLDGDAAVTSSDDVYVALENAMPAGLAVLNQAPATDQDSYVVTRKFADAHGLTSIGDLAGAGEIMLGGNSELETRPYGPEGLRAVYGVSVAFTPIEDSGGPLTVKALRDGQVQLVDLYSANPVFVDGDLVALEDPEGMFLASHVVPLVSDRVDAGAIDIINRVSAVLTGEDLVALNAVSVNDESPAAAIAGGWLREKDLL